MINRNNLLGTILIVLGIIIILVVASEFLVRAAVAFFGFCLIYSGLELKNNRQFTFFIHRSRRK